jgi:hypothetical protein
MDFLRGQLLSVILFPQRNNANTKKWIHFGIRGPTPEVGKSKVTFKSGKQTPLAEK